MALSHGGRRALREAAGWAALGVLVVAGSIYFNDIYSLAHRVIGPPHLVGDNSKLNSIQAAQTARAQRPAESPIVELRAGRNGHFFAQAEINGRPIDVLVDTGASGVGLSYEDAEGAGIHVQSNDFIWHSHTANGVVKVAPVTIDRISIGDITVRNVQGTVAEPGRMSTGTLLGMSFLNRLRRVEMRDGTLLLQE
jgi:aspartyl protease family protein